MKIFPPKFSKEFSSSNDIVKIVKVMLSHFQRFHHWYKMDEIIEKSSFELRIENIANDEALEEEWANWYMDFRYRPEDVINSIGLAIHTFLMSDKSNNQMKKIFVK